MKILKTLIVSIICFSLQGCPNDTDQDKHDMILRIKNNTNHVIYCPFDYNEIPLLPIRFPEFPYHQSLNSNEVFKINIYNNAFKNNKKLWILIYKQSTLDTHTWQEIKEQGLYDKRYDFTRDQLRDINYEIIYDGI